MSYRRLPWLCAFAFLMEVNILYFLPCAHGEDSKVQVGFIVPLSGALAGFGQAIERGVSLALEEVPAERRIVLPVYEDSRYEAKSAVNAFHRLAGTRAVRLLYVFGGPMSDALAPLAERLKVPMFSTEYDVRYTRGKTYVIRFANDAQDYAHTLLSELRKRGFRRFGLIKVENQYHNTLSRAFLDLLSPQETAVLLANFPPGESDFRSVITRLEGESFDALGIYLTPGMQLSFLKQLALSGYNGPLFGSDSFESRAENFGVENFVEGSMFANAPVSEEFERTYKARFGDTTQLVHAALAFDFTRLTLKVLSNLPPQATSAMIVDRFSRRGVHNGVCGEYEYVSTPESGQYFKFPLAIKVVRKGEALPLQ